jgi:hypothetical protein
VKVFISYRREDTKNLARLIADRINAVDAVGEVFLDVNTIQAGQKFEQETDHAVFQSDVVIVLIGENWRGPCADTSARIFADADFVRGEVRQALGSTAKVLPVLVDGATMPKASELPQDLAQLPEIDAVHLDHVSFERDIDQLIADVLGDPSYKRDTQSVWRRYFGLFAQMIMGALAAAIGLFLLGLIHFAITDGQSLEQTIGGLAGVIALSVIVISAGALYPYFRGRLKR